MAEQKDVAYWRENRQRQYDRVESMCSNPPPHEMLSIVARVLEYGGADGYHVIQVIPEPGDNRILVTIERPGGKGMEFVTLYVEDG